MAKERKVNDSFRIEERKITQIKEIADELGLTKSEYYREAIIEKLEKDIKQKSQKR